MRRPRAKFHPALVNAPRLPLRPSRRSRGPPLQIVLKPSAPIRGMVGGTMPTARPLRVAFVMEIGLGHTTIYKLFQRAVAADPFVEATWLPVQFKPDEWSARIPKVRTDVVLCGGIKGWSQLRAAMKATRFDAVYFHTQMVAVLCGSIMKRVPSVVSIDATPSQFAAMGAYYGLPDRMRTSLRERIRERWYRDVFTSARCVVSVSRWASEAVEREYGVAPDRSRVFYPGVDLDLWRPGTKEDAGPVRLLFVGGEFIRKGGDMLLRWMREGGHRHCTLDIVTRDPQESVGGVTFHHGLQANDERLLELYRAADLFVLPTRADAASLVAVEAMASGTPVLTTRVGGIPEWVGPQGEAAILIEPDNDEALHDALESIRARSTEAPGDGGACAETRRGHLRRAREREDATGEHSATRKRGHWRIARTLGPWRDVSW